MPSSSTERIPTPQRKEFFMPVFLELREGHPGLDQAFSTPGQPGPVLGPFLAFRLLRDELRVNTS
jgi:hypothetical protein